MAAAITCCCCVCFFRKPSKRGKTRAREPKDDPGTIDNMGYSICSDAEAVPKHEHTFPFRNTVNEAYSKVPAASQPPTTMESSKEERTETVETNDSGYDIITAESLMGSTEPGPSSPTTVPLHRYESDPFINRHYENELEHDRNEGEENIYDQPFIEPATKEEELHLQLFELNVGVIQDDAIKLLECLGSGQFGTVHKGVWVQVEDGNENSTEVAVKTISEGATEGEKILFLQEAAIMGQFRHSNILRMLGIVREGDSLKIVMNLAKNGDLHKHLPRLKASIDKYTPCEMKQLLMSFSRQIASGLAYLYIKCYVHRDLAARNILVSEDGVCQIADFGLSRNLQNEDDYYTSHGGKIPVKWTAPEAIHYRKYSSASDIWSYGCLLYEIWSFGEKPFSHLTNLEAIRAVSNGYRLPPPAGCVRPLYKIMIACWHPVPESRPHPDLVVTQLQKADFRFFEWPREELNVYTELSRTVGAPLEHGRCLHVDLQHMYAPAKSPTDKNSNTSEQQSMERQGEHAP